MFTFLAKRVCRKKGHVEQRTLLEYTADTANRIVHVRWHYYCGRCHNVRNVYKDIPMLNQRGTT